MYKSGCIICGEELAYTEQKSKLFCAVCSKKFDANVQCKNGHYVCDNCHQFSAVEYIENYCKHTFKLDPLQIAIEIMKNPNIKMHGPEHHFLVPAVLLAAYNNFQHQHEKIGEKLMIAKERSALIPGGFCGFYGNCGAGVGTGIFMSIIQNATPLSKNEWKLCNLMTAKSLENIGNNGGPRCCKRDVFLAIESAINFLAKNMNIGLPKNSVKCTFYHMNKECKGKECRYFPEPLMNTEERS